MRSRERTLSEDESTASVSGDTRDSTDFEDRLRECHRLVYQVAFGVLGNRADAEDVAQDVFLRAFRKLSNLRDGSKFRAWVARMSFRLALNRQRAGARALRRDTSWVDSTVSAPPMSAEAIVAAREFQRRLRNRIDRLPKKLRVVVLLSAVEDLSTRDIARLLRIPEGTVRSRLHLARRELLGAFCDERM